MVISALQYYSAPLEVYTICALECVQVSVYTSLYYNKVNVVYTIYSGLKVYMYPII